MTEAEAKKILTEYGAPANIAQHIEAINTAIRVLGGESDTGGNLGMGKEARRIRGKEWQDLITK